MTPIMYSTSVGLSPARTSSRLRGERARQLEALLAGDGQMQRQHVQTVVEAHRNRRLARHRVRTVQWQVLAAETGAHGAILQHRHVSERLHDLMRAGEAVAGNDKWFLTGDVDAVEDDPPGIRREHAIDQVEQRRLAGAVRPEAPADVVEFEERRHSSTRWVLGKRL
jgi:hypothetical protein